MRHSRRQDGFTTIELIISILILGIILAPLLSSYVLGLATTSAANSTSSNSSDAQNLSAFFSSDVASAEQVSLTAGCGTGTQVVLFDLGSGAIPRYVSYVAAPDTAAAADGGFSQVYALNRVTCDVNMAQTSSLPVALSMKQLPTVTCSPNACTAAASQPQTVTLDVTEWGAKSTDDAYTFRVSGTRRVT